MTAPTSPGDDVLMAACETLCKAMCRGIGTCVVGRQRHVPQNTKVDRSAGPWIATMTSSDGDIVFAAATSKRAAIEGLYCSLWYSADRRLGWGAPSLAPGRFTAIREAMAQTEGLFGLPQGNDDPSP